MGKQVNAQVLRFSKNEDWLSKYYCNNYNYSNLIIQDNIIRDYVINFISFFNTKVVQVYIYREKHRVIIRIFSYNDSFTNWKSFLIKQRKKINYRDNLAIKLLKSNKNSLNSKHLKFSDCFIVKEGLSDFIYFLRNNHNLDFISHNNSFISYSGKRLLALNLSYLLKTNVIVKNTNIISKSQRSLLLKLFTYMGFRLRSPLSKYLRIKFICLVYYSFLYKSSLLLCRYLCFIIPRFCKKKRKSRKINAFLKSLRSVIRLMFSSSFLNQISIKGIKVLVKGRINGSRRKRTYVIKKGRTSTQSFSNDISYYQEDCLTIFGILGIKVWIIY